MDGVGGQEGWRWIFILEGIATVVLGVMCFFLLIDSPRKSGSWLEPEEIRYLELQHFIKEGGHFKEKKKTNWKDVKATLLNWRMYMLAFILLAQSACSYGTANLSYLVADSILTVIYRNEILPSHNHQSHGLPRHKRPAHDRAPLRGRRNLRRLLQQAF